MENTLKSKNMPGIGIEIFEIAWDILRHLITQTKMHDGKITASLLFVCSAHFPSRITLQS